MPVEQYADESWNGTGSSVFQEVNLDWQQLAGHGHHQLHRQRRCRPGETANCVSTSAPVNHSSIINIRNVKFVFFKTQTSVSKIQLLSELFV